MIYDYTPVSHAHAGDPQFSSDPGRNYYSVTTIAGDRGTWLGDVAGPEPGGLLHISGRARVSAGGAAKPVIMVLFYDANNSIVSEVLHRTPGGDWEEFAASVTVPDNAVRRRVDLRLWGGPGTAEWEALRISDEAPTPPDPPDPPVEPPMPPIDQDYAVYKLPVPRSDRYWTATISERGATLTYGDPPVLAADYIKHLIEYPPEVAEGE